MSSSLVAYNPNDPVQQRFLSALALGESGNSSYAATEGFGGVNLAGDPSDQYGFPEQDPGSNVSSAAGIFQFTQGTWDQVASQYGLNFSNVSDQDAGAWYYAQQVYQQQTGSSLYGDLSSGNYGSLDSALSKAWPSVMGNGANPQGLAAAIIGGEGSDAPFPGLHPRHPAARAHRALALLAVAHRLQSGSSETSKIGSNAVASSPSEGSS